MPSASAPVRRRPLMVAACLVLLVAALAGAWLAAGRPWTTTDGGPVQGLGRVGGSHPVWEGRTAYSGLTMLENVGDEPAVLESVRPLDVPADLSLLHTYVVGPDREYDGLAGGHIWPQPVEYPAAALKPVEGFVVPPASQKTRWGRTNIVFVFRAERPGTFGWRLVEVKYRVGRKQYRRVIGIVDQVCTRPDSVKEMPSCEGDIELTTDEEIADA